MLRLAYYLYRLSSSIQYRLGRRLTAAGWLALIGVVLCGFVGIDLDQSVASQTFALLFCLLLVAMVWGLSFRGRFRVERRLPRFGSVGRPFTYRVSLRDAAKKARRELELFEDLADPRPTREEYIQLARAGAKRSFRLTRTATAFFEHRRAVVKAACLP